MLLKEEYTIVIYVINPGKQYNTTANKYKKRK